MSVNPDLRNQHTTLDALKAKNTVHTKCESCGCGVSRSGSRGAKRFCSPCADERYAQARKAQYRKRAEKRKRAVGSEA